MSAADCRHARLHIGATPHELPADVTAHLARCVDCSRFREETLTLDGRVRSALELPLAQFRERPAAPRRRLALAASVAMALLLGGGVWLLQPRPALAGEIAEHVSHEAGSWDKQRPLDEAAIVAVLQQAGVQFDTSMPVVYAMACPFRGRRVPHLVVQTAAGPMTVMLLAGEKIAARREFSEHGYRGVLLPAGSGSVAVLAREGEVPDAVASEVMRGVRW